MKSRQETVARFRASESAAVRTTSLDSPGSERRRIAVVWWVGLATVAFAEPLTTLMLRAADSELLSYILVIAFVAGWLLYMRRHSLPTTHRSAIPWAVALSILACTAVVGSFKSRAMLSVNDSLALMILGYVCIIAAGGFLFLGSKWMVAAAFPVAFLIFLVPPPDAAVSWLETASVRGSADVAAWFFRMTGTPFLRDATVFTLPGIVLQVAQECSGIHSSWVLFITSLVASHMFLERPWRRFVLVAFVIPLAIVRNGFRILTIGLLCVHVGPHMINSIIHRRGGPLFFALSLVPLFLLLSLLRSREPAHR
jgi:exosortase C (VPDSG-CTERM-specific)